MTWAAVTVAVRVAVTVWRLAVKLGEMLVVAKDGLLVVSMAEKKAEMTAVETVEWSAFESVVVRVVAKEPWSAELRVGKRVVQMALLSVVASASKTAGKMAGKMAARLVDELVGKSVGALVGALAVELAVEKVVSWDSAMAERRADRTVRLSAGWMVLRLVGQKVDWSAERKAERKAEWLVDLLVGKMAE